MLLQLTYVYRATKGLLNGHTVDLDVLGQRTGSEMGRVGVDNRSMAKPPNKRTMTVLGSILVWV